MPAIAPAKEGLRARLQARSALVGRLYRACRPALPRLSAGSTALAGRRVPIASPPALWGQIRPFPTTRSSAPQRPRFPVLGSTTTIFPLSRLAAAMASGPWPHDPGARPSKIVCIGRNYPAHAAELGHEVPQDPVLFLKPPSSLLPSGSPIRIPPGIGSVHHEVELGVIIGRRLTGARAAETPGAIRGWALAIDLTARDLQNDAKQRGLPWTVAKGYDTFCPCSIELSATEVDPRDARLELRVDEAVRQQGNTADMLWSIPDLLAYVSAIMTLEPGDLVLTGTPEGVGPIGPGQHVEAFLDGRRLLDHEALHQTRPR